MPLVYEKNVDIVLPSNYRYSKKKMYLILNKAVPSKNKLPHGGQNTVFVGRTSFTHPLQLSNQSLLNPGIDIKDIPNVHDGDTSITLNGFFLVRWTDR